MTMTGSCIRSIVAPLWAVKERSPYLTHLKSLDSAKKRPLSEVTADQLNRLRRLLSHAGSNTEFYSRTLGCAVGNPETVTWEEFSQIPLLSKDLVRSNRDKMVASNVPQEQLTPRKTSGSTGVSLDFFVDSRSMQWKRAVTISFDRWAGWNIGEKIGAIWGNPQHNINWRARLRNALLERYQYLDTLQMDEVSMMGFYKKLLSYKPAILFGHAHSLYLFARFLEERGLTGIYPRGIISTCMVLHDFERQGIERVFGCKVTNRYGCEEVSLIACQCQEGNMHLNCDTLIVEILKNGKPAGVGEAGAIVVTDLTNYGMPFIRYKVGDVGVLSGKTSCRCGCTYPVLESLQGRVADYVVTPDGYYISGISLTENFAMRLPGVKQLQIVQDQLDFLRFRVVKGELFGNGTVAEIDSLARERFGDGMRWEVEYTDSIQSEKSGKYRFCISKIQNNYY